MITNSMYGIPFLDRLLVPMESIEVKPNEAYGIHVL